MMVNSKLLSWIGFLCFGIGVLIVFESIKPTLITYLQNKDLLPREESYTELYIENHTELPVQMDEDTIATASFTIRNMEQTEVTYPYEIAEHVNGERVVFSSGESKVVNQELKSIPFEYKGTTPYAEKRIEVTLLNKNQSIYFWITNIPQP